LRGYPGWRSTLQQLGSSQVQPENDFKTVENIGQEFSGDFWGLCLPSAVTRRHSESSKYYLIGPGIQLGKGVAALCKYKNELTNKTDWNLSDFIEYSCLCLDRAHDLLAED